MITESAKMAPETARNFCQLCGSETHTTCLHCGYEIPGALWGRRGGRPWAHEPRAINFLLQHCTQPPAFCGSCGKPFPWTVYALDAVSDLADEIEGLEPAERALLKGAIPDLIHDTPRTEVAVARFKRFTAKAAPPVMEGLKQIIITIATEAVKHKLFPG